MNRIGIIIVLFVLFSGCSKSFENKEAMMSYLKNSEEGYYQKKVTNGVAFSLLYRPTDLLVEQELGSQSNPILRDSLREKYRKYMYFNLSISKGGQELLSAAPKNRNEFGAMVNQLAFGMQDKVHLFTQSKDTLELADYIYPRMYGMSKATAMLFVYPRDKKALKGEYLNLTIEDLGLFTGEVKFKIPIQKIKNEPKLINF